MQTPTLQHEYKEKIIKELQQKLALKNINQVPSLEKITINCSIGSDSDRSQALEEAKKAIQAICGQKSLETKAKLSISNFKLREGNPIGTKVTLRGKYMYEFLLKFLRIAVPTIRDFRGLSPKSFDGQGNYTVGIKDHTIFPEIDLDKTNRTLGFDITFVTSTNENKQAFALLESFGMPFRKHKKNA